MDMSENTFGVSSSPLCVGNWLQQHNVFPVLDCEVQLVVWVKVAVQGLGDDFRLCLLRQWVHVLVFSALLGSTMDTRSCLSLRSLGDFTQFQREGGLGVHTWNLDIISCPLHPAVPVWCLCCLRCIFFGSLVDTQFLRQFTAAWQRIHRFPA